MPRYKTAKPQKEITLEDLEAWLQNCEDKVIRSLLICLWVYGLRISEALTLHRENFTRVDGGLQVNTVTLKRSGEEHRVLWASDSTPYIQELVSYVFTLDQTALVFKMHRKTAWKKLKRLHETLCPHRFRHNRATKFAIARATPYELQTWLGHSDIRMSVKYIHGSGIIARDLGKRVEIK